MESATIRATKREELGSRPARRLRREGLVPAVLYGHRRDTVHLSVPLRDIERVVAAGTRMVNLEIGGTVETALLKEIQYDAMGDHLIHADLSRVAMDEKVTVTVLVELHGLAKGAVSGGTLDHLVQDIDVSCLPGDIPERVRIEIGDMDIGDIIHIRDIQPPPGVEFLQDPDMPVVTIHPPVAAVEEVAPEEVAVEAQPEVIGGRRGEEESAGEEGKRG